MFLDVEAPSETSASSDVASENVVFGELVVIQPTEYEDVLRRLDLLEDYFGPRHSENLYERCVRNGLLIFQKQKTLIEHQTALIARALSSYPSPVTASVGNSWVLRNSLLTQRFVVSGVTVPLHA